MQLLRKFSANNKISVFKYKSLAERSDRESLPYACSRREHNRSRIRYRLLTNWKIIRAMVSACPAIFRRSQCIRTERHLFVWEDRNPLRWACKIRNVQFLIYLCRDTTPIYRGLHLEIWKNQWILILHHFSENSFQFFCLWCYRHVWWMKYIFPSLSIVHLHVHRMQ